MNNLEPRAKIGDVVIVTKAGWKIGKRTQELRQLKVDNAVFMDFEPDEGDPYPLWRYKDYTVGISFYDKDILKNLTTGKEYGNE